MVSRCGRGVGDAKERRFADRAFPPSLRYDASAIITGISVYPPADEKTGRLNNQEIGKSSTAGAYAIGQTAASRVFTNM